MKLSDERRLATLREYGTAEMGRDVGLDALCNLVRLTLKVPIATITIVDEKIAYQIGSAGLETQAVPAETSFSSLAIETASPVLVEDATKDARFAANPLVRSEPGIRSYLGAPLIATDGSAIGAVSAVDTNVRRFTKEDGETLAYVAHTAVQILAMRLRVKEVRNLALTDGLTGIANRTGMELEIEKAIAVLRRHGQPFSLLYMDVDGFKEINDQRGHEAGDELLHLIGQALAFRTRREETCGRVGGDEFCTLMIGADEQEGKDAATSIKARLDAMVKQADFPVGFSMGLALFATPPDSVAEAMRKADGLLYEAKRKGKNQIMAS